MKKNGKVRKSFRNFILSRIAKSLIENEFFDLKIQTGDVQKENIFAHKFVLGALCPGEYGYGISV